MQAARLCTSLIRSADQTEELWQPQSTTEAERFVAAQRVEGHVARLSAHSRLKPEMFLGTSIGHLLQWSLVSISPECHVPFFCAIIKMPSSNALVLTHESHSSQWTK